MRVEAFPLFTTEPQPMLLVGASLSRTGTSSLKVALEKLGHKIFHSHDLLAGDVTKLFAEVTRAELAGDKQGYDKSVKSLINELSRLGYTGTVDLPMCLLFREFMEAYPDAKVLLTVRGEDDNSVQKWADSIVSIATNIITFIFKRPFTWVPLRIRSDLHDIFEEWYWNRLGVPMENVTLTGIPEGQYGAGSMITAETAKGIYYRYVDAVTEAVPPERLVRFNVKEGWGPLCEHFLRPGYVCPSDEPFPRSNARENGYALRFIQVFEFLHRTWPMLFGILLLLVARMFLSFVVSSSKKKERKMKMI